MRVGLLECDHVGRRFAGIAGDYRDMFGELFGRYRPEVELVAFDVVAERFPPSVGACDGYLCTGSRFSAYDDAAWIARLESFVRELHDSHTPFVGICFGHQVLARALGGEVAPAGDGWGVGVHAMSVEGTAGWMAPPRDPCVLRFMHHDQVLVPPPGAALLGRTEHCPVAMFQHGPTSLGIQAHPEFGAAFTDALVRDRTAAIGEERAAAALARADQPTDEAVVTAWMARFLAGEGT